MEPHWASKILSGARYGSPRPIQNGGQRGPQKLILGAQVGLYVGGGFDGQEAPVDIFLSAQDESGEAMDVPTRCVSCGTPN